MPDQLRPSETAFLRMVDERYGQFRDRLREFAATLAGTNQQDKIEKASRLLAAASALKDALADPDQPTWLQPITTATQNYSQHPTNGHVIGVLADAIGTHYGAAVQHDWAFMPSDDGAFDFDALYELHQSQSQIPVLFDKLIESLEKVVQCDDLDSRRAIHALEMIIATLKKNQKGSFFSLICTWDFTAVFIKNVAWELLAEIPGLRAVVKAVRETMGEIDTAMTKLHRDVATDLHKKLAVEFPALEYRPIPLPELLALSNESDIIDVEAKMVDESTTT